MKGPAYRIYREGFPHHTYTRAINGSIVFYSEDDCLFYLTLYSCLARKYKIRTLAFSIMPNHCHSDEKADCKRHFLAFHDDLNAQFASGYNRKHNRSGSLWESPFGYAAKTVGKKIRDNLCYIVNNHVVGKLSDDILSYRWNLLPYYRDDHPFSEKIVLSRASRPMRRAVDRVKYFRAHNLPLDYVRQKWVFQELDKKERNQIIDFIISRYNCLDFDAMLRFYGKSFEQACTTFRANSGNEHDIPEDYEDYRVYVQMMQLVRKRGVDLKTCNFEIEEPYVIREWMSLFREFGFQDRQINRFLHRKKADTTKSKRQQSMVRGS